MPRRTARSIGVHCRERRNESQGRVRAPGAASEHGLRVHVHAIDPYREVQRIIAMGRATATDQAASANQRSRCHRELGQIRVRRLEASAVSDGHGEIVDNRAGERDGAARSSPDRRSG